MSNNLVFNLFSISGLFLGFISLLMAFFLFILGKSNLHKVLALFNLSIAIWGFSAFNIGNQHNIVDAISAWRLAFIGVIFISIFFYHGMCLFCDINRSIVLIFAYSQGLFFLLISQTKFYISEVFLLNNSIFFLKSTGFVFPISFAFWIFLVSSGFIELLIKFRKFQGIKRSQAAYLLFSFGIGFLGGTTNFFPMFGVNILPFGNITIPLYCLLVTYAILRYKILDLKLVFTRLGVFTAVYSLILGVPVWLGYKLLGVGLWLFPVTCMGVFATAGPFIYLFFQKRAEDRLLQEQRRYQETLRQASAGMGKIKDLKKLLNMIVYVLTHAIQIEHATIYIFDENTKSFTLAASKKRSMHGDFTASIGMDHPLVVYINQQKSIIVLEDLRQRSIDFNDTHLNNIVKKMLDFDGALFVPIYIAQQLTAIIIMGRKISGKVYTEDDLSVFAILSNQTALAIENAKFYEDMKRTQDQLFQAEKMATIGTMADGLSHQINNRFHAMGFIAGDALDTIQMNQHEAMSDHLKQVFTDLNRAFVRVQENVVQGGEIVQGLLKYTRKNEAGFTAVDVDAVLKAALEMVQFKIKLHALKIVRDYDVLNMPKVKANFTQLQEVFFNLIDNAYDAMMQRKNEISEDNYQPVLIVRVFIENKSVSIVFQDNGMGVKDLDINKLFTPFFTTKLSSKKGTGLGLYVIKKIIEENHGGEVIMLSKYKEGTQMKLLLPIAIV